MLAYCSIVLFKTSTKTSTTKPSKQLKYLLKQLCGFGYPLIWTAKHATMHPLPSGECHFPSRDRQNFQIEDPPLLNCFRKSQCSSSCLSSPCIGIRPLLRDAFAISAAIARIYNVAPWDTQTEENTLAHQLLEGPNAHLFQSQHRGPKGQKFSFLLLKKKQYTANCVQSISEKLFAPCHGYMNLSSMHVMVTQKAFPARLDSLRD